MNITPCNGINFKSALPVWCFARDPESENKQYYPVVNPKNMDKCFNFIVRNLNGTAGKNNKSDEFVKSYAEIDSDYRKNNIACSVTKPKQQYGFLFTGDNDVASVRLLGKILGHARAYNKEVQANEKTYELKNTDSYEANDAKEMYFREAMNYTRDKGLKDENGQRLGMGVFFDAVYKTNKNGEREFKGFKYNNMKIRTVELKS